MLRCVSKYKSSLGSYQPGDIIEAPELIAALLADSPGSFAIVVPEVVVAAPEEPDQNKAILSPRKGGRK